MFSAILLTLDGGPCGLFGAEGTADSVLCTEGAGRLTGANLGLAGRGTEPLFRIKDTVKC
jgi:hypothetical protein